MNIFEYSGLDISNPQRQHKAIRISKKNIIAHWDLRIWTCGNIIWDNSGIFRKLFVIGTVHMQCSVSSQMKVKAVCYNRAMISSPSSVPAFPLSQGFPVRKATYPAHIVINLHQRHQKPCAATRDSRGHLIFLFL